MTTKSRIFALFLSFFMLLSVVDPAVAAGLRGKGGHVSAAAEAETQTGEVSPDAEEDFIPYADEDLLISILEKEIPSESGEASVKKELLFIQASNKTEAKKVFLLSSTEKNARLDISFAAPEEDPAAAEAASPENEQASAEEDPLKGAEYALLPMLDKNGQEKMSADNGEPETLTLYRQANAFGGFDYIFVLPPAAEGAEPETIYFELPCVLLSEEEKAELEKLKAESAAAMTAEELTALKEEADYQQALTAAFELKEKEAFCLLAGVSGEALEEAQERASQNRLHMESFEAVLLENIPEAAETAPEGQEPEEPADQPADEPAQPADTQTEPDPAEPEGPVIKEPEEPARLPAAEPDEEPANTNSGNKKNGPVRAPLRATPSATTAPLVVDDLTVTTTGLSDGKWTGEVITSTITVSRTSAETNDTYRIYYDFSDIAADANGVPVTSAFAGPVVIRGNGLPIIPGNSYYQNEQLSINPYFYEKVPGYDHLYYIEIPEPETGSTFEMNLSLFYPSPNTHGGSVKIWAVEIPGTLPGDPEGKNPQKLVDGQVGKRLETAEETFTYKITYTVPSVPNDQENSFSLSDVLPESLVINGTPTYTVTGGSAPGLNLTVSGGSVQLSAQDVYEDVEIYEMQTLTRDVFEEQEVWDEETQQYVTKLVKTGEETYEDLVHTGRYERKPVAGQQYVKDLAGKTIILSIPAKFAPGTTAEDMIASGSIAASNEATATLNGSSLKTNKTVVDFPADDYMESADGKFQTATWKTARNEVVTTKQAASGAKPEVIHRLDKNGYYVSGLAWEFATTSNRPANYPNDGFGQDFVKKIEYKDVIELPAGTDWDSGILDAVAAGNVTVTRSGSQAFVNVRVGSNTIRLATLENAVFMENPSISVEGGKLALKWSFTNSSSAAEIDFSRLNSSKPAIRFGDNVIRVTETVVAGKEYTFTNKVNTTEKYTHTGDNTHVSQAPLTAAVKPGEAKIEKSHQAPTVVRYGSSVDFTIRAYNEGTLDAEATAIRDTLPDMYFLTPLQMQDMFQAVDDPATAMQLEGGGSDLTITIQNARICENLSAHSVTVAGGGTANTDPQYNGSHPEEQDYSYGQSTDPCKLTDNGSITLTRLANGQIQIQRAAVGSSVTAQTLTVPSNAAAIQDALNQLGMVIIPATTYSAQWPVPGGSINGGESVIRKIQATVKDSFMLLSGDTRWQAADPKTSANSATLTTPGGSKTATDSSVSATREWRIDKDATVEGKKVTRAEQIQAETVVDYTLKVSRESGGTEYDALPLTDEIRGAQVLMVRAAANSHLAGGPGVEEKIIDGVDYYLLIGPGTYSGVVFDAELSRYGVKSNTTMTADSVTVTKNADNKGHNTLIRWYLDSDSYGMVYDLTAKYKVFIDPDRTEYTNTAGATGMELDNTGFLGDHQSERLFDNTEFELSLLSADKHIVTQRGATPQEDAIAKSSVMTTGGETVTYRLTINNPTGEPITLSEAEVYDALPKVLSGAAGDTTLWVKGANVLSVELPAQANITESTGINTWRISQTPPSGTEDPDDPSQQYIIWDNLTLTFTGDAFIYVTVKYPEGAAWDNWKTKYGSEPWINTWHVRDHESSVNHFSSGITEAELFKSVADTGVFSSATTAGAIDKTETGRLYYVNNYYGRGSGINSYNTSGVPHGWKSPRMEDSGFVVYQTTLYNSGNTRLYINEIQDQLPEGIRILGGADVTNHEFSIGGLTSVNVNWPVDASGAWISTIEDPSGKTPTGKIFAVHAVADRESGKITFTIDNTFPIDEGSNQPVAINGHTQGNLSYDPIEDKFFLNPGEAISFAYWCQVLNAMFTEKTATNTIGMPFYDKYNQGVTVNTGVKHISDDYNPHNKNDGKAEKKTNAQVSADPKYGFTGGDSSTEWLTSEVTLQQAPIIPGISKKIVGRKTVSGQTYTNAQDLEYVGYTDTLTWEIKAYNDAPLEPIQDYVISDIIDAPYVYTGDIILRLPYSLSGISNNYILRLGAWNSTYTEVEATAADNATDQGFYISPTTFTMKTDGTIYNILSYGSAIFQVSMTRLADGRLRLDVRCAPSLYNNNWYGYASNDTSLSPNRTATLTVSTVNPTNDYSYSQVYNDSILTPVLQQEWDKGAVSHGSNIIDSTGITEGWSGRYTSTAGDSPFHSYNYGYYNHLGATVTTPRNAVEAGAIVYIDQNSATKSVKSVTNGTETAVSSTEAEWIDLESRNQEFTYTLEVTNRLQNEIPKMVVIDSLPQTGDHYSFYASHKRYSDFQVDLADNPNFRLAMEDENGTVTAIPSSKYRLEFSDKTVFTDADWNGNAGTDWYSSKRSTTRSFRIVIDESAAPYTFVQKGKLTIQFNAKVSDSAVIGDETATAWNTFGYSYLPLGSSGTPMRSTPLKVGVRIPGQEMSIQKKLVSKNEDGTTSPQPASEDTVYRFLIYKGSLPNNPGTLTYNLYSQWNNGTINLPFTIVEVPVVSGASQSAKIDISSLKEWETDAGVSYWFRETGTDWVWDNSADYGILEIKHSPDWSLLEFDEARQPLTGGVFTLNPAGGLELTGTNVLTWHITLEKQDENGNALGDPAVFALYSPNAADGVTAVIDLINNEDFPDYYKAGQAEYYRAQGILNTPLSVVGEDGKTYYLTSIRQTSRQIAGSEWSPGFLSWKDLTEAKYLVKELVAPPGYMISGSGERIVARRNAVVVPNRNPEGVPSTGPAGLSIFGSGDYHGSDLEFPNEPALGSLLVTKSLRGEKADPAKAFSFTVTLTPPERNGTQLVVNGVYGSMTFVNNAATFTLKGGEEAYATGLPAGTTYTVTENDYTADGYYTVKEGDTGEITANELQTAAFTNAYLEITEPLTFEKHLQMAGDAFPGTFPAGPEEAGLFSFILEGTAPADNTYYYRTVNEADGSVNFEMPVYTAAHAGQTFSYRAYEAEPDPETFYRLPEHASYFIIEDTVGMEEGELVISRTVREITPSLNIQVIDPEKKFINKAYPDLHLIKTGSRQLATPYGSFFILPLDHTQLPADPEVRVVQETYAFTDLSVNATENHMLELVKYIKTGTEPDSVQLRMNILTDKAAPFTGSFDYYPDGTGTKQTVSCDAYGNAVITVTANTNPAQEATARLVFPPEVREVLLFQKDCNTLIYYYPLLIQPLEGIPFQLIQGKLTGTLAQGKVVEDNSVSDPVKTGTTDINGAIHFEGLLPGYYLLREAIDPADLDENGMFTFKGRKYFPLPDMAVVVRENDSVEVYKTHYLDATIYENSGYYAKPVLELRDPEPVDVELLKTAAGESVRRQYTVNIKQTLVWRNLPGSFTEDPNQPKQLTLKPMGGGSRRNLMLNFALSKSIDAQEKDALLSRFQISGTEYEDYDSRFLSFVPYVSNAVTLDMDIYNEVTITMPDEVEYVTVSGPGGVYQFANYVDGAWVWSDVGSYSFRDGFTPLPGAQFELYKWNEDTKLYERIRTNETFESNSEGKLYLRSLAPGDYKLVETQAPDGYAKADPVFITVREDGSYDMKNAFRREDGLYYLTDPDGKPGSLIIDKRTYHTEDSLLGSLSSLALRFGPTLLPKWKSPRPPRPVGADEPAPLSALLNEHALTFKAPVYEPSLIPAGTTNPDMYEYTDLMNGRKAIEYQVVVKNADGSAAPDLDGQFGDINLTDGAGSFTMRPGDPQKVLRLPLNDDVAGLDWKVTVTAMAAPGEEKPARMEATRVTEYPTRASATVYSQVAGEEGEEQTVCIVTYDLVSTADKAYTPLAGAGFTLTKVDENGTPLEDEHGDPITVSPDAAATNENGRLTFSSIPTGTYYLEETNVPPGYQPAAIRRVTVDGEGNLTVKRREIDEGSGEVSWIPEEVTSDGRLPIQNEDVPDIEEPLVVYKDVNGTRVSDIDPQSEELAETLKYGRLVGEGADAVYEGYFTFLLEKGPKYENSLAPADPLEVDFSGTDTVTERNNEHGEVRFSPADGLLRYSHTDAGYTFFYRITEGAIDNTALAAELSTDGSKYIIKDVVSLNNTAHRLEVTRTRYKLDPEDDVPESIPDAAHMVFDNLSHSELVVKKKLIGNHTEADRAFEIIVRIMARRAREATETEEAVTEQPVTPAMVTAAGVAPRIKIVNTVAEAPDNVVLEESPAYIDNNGRVWILLSPMPEPAPEGESYEDADEVTWTRLAEGIYGRPILLKGDEEAVITGLVQGWHYEVTEADYTADGYVTTLPMEAAGTLSSENASKAEVFNARNALQLHKISASTRNTLTGAKFAIYKVVEGAEKPVGISLKAGSEYVLSNTVLEASQDKVGNAFTMTDGSARIILPPALAYELYDEENDTELTVVYKIYEIQAPAGYFTNPDPWTVEISRVAPQAGSAETHVYGHWNIVVKDQDGAVIQQNTLTQEELAELEGDTPPAGLLEKERWKGYHDLENVLMYDLPSVGGLSTQAFTVFGTMFLALAGWWLWKCRRENEAVL